MELEKALADENLEEIDIKPLANRILLQVRNKLGIGGGIATGIIFIAGPNPETDPKIITIMGALAMTSAVIGTAAGEALFLKECWDNRNQSPMPTTYSGENW